MWEIQHSGPNFRGEELSEIGVQKYTNFSEYIEQLSMLPWFVSDFRYIAAFRNQIASQSKRRPKFALRPHGKIRRAEFAFAKCFSSKEGRTFNRKI